MRTRSILTVVLLVSALAALAIRHNPVAGAEPPPCFDIITNDVLPATKWLDAPGALIGTSGRDVLVGSYGSDTITGLGGNDVICSHPYADDPSIVDAFDIIDGGAGADSIFAQGSIKGGAGNDAIIVDLGSSIADGETGNDTVYALLITDVDAGIARGGAGDDNLLAEKNGSADGGSGDDKVTGDNAATLLGGSGSDQVFNLEGTPSINCGSGSDGVRRNGATDVKSCESNI